jgi:hypothetical protein
MSRALLDLPEEDFEAEMRRLGLGERLRPPADAADATERDALRARAEKAEAHLALILRVLDEEIQTCEAHAAASRSDALACRAAASAGQPAPAAAGFLHLTDAERIRLHENCATRAALEALGLRAVRRIVDAAIAKATKEPTA